MHDDAALVIDGWRLEGGEWVGSDGTRLRAIAGGKSGGKTTTVVQTNIPPPSAEEKALLSKQNELLGIQIEEIKRQNEAFASIFPEQRKFLEASTRAATAAVEAQQRALERTERIAEKQTGLLEELVASTRETPTQQEIRELSEQHLLALLKGEEPPISEAKRRNIEEAFGAARELGTQDIIDVVTRSATERGLRPTDTPIQEITAREAGRLSTALRGAEAEAKLGLTSAAEAFTNAVQQFSQNLQQRAFQNRLSLTGTVGGQSIGLPLAGIPPLATGLPGQVAGSISPLVDALGRQRVAGATRSETVQSSQSLLPNLISAGATLGGGLGSALILASSATLKRDILPLDRDEYDRALAKVRETPVTRWRYRWERNDDRAPHIGPIAELSPEEIREDRLRVNVLDYAGLLHAALKAVDRKVERLEARLPVRPATLPVGRRAA